MKRLILISLFFSMVLAGCNQVDMTASNAPESIRMQLLQLEIGNQELAEKFRLLEQEYNQKEMQRRQKER